MHFSHIAIEITITYTNGLICIFKQMFTNKIHFSTAKNGDDLASMFL